MKVVFLCGSLEKGKDGVGDYTRRLGAELTRLGHSITAVALNDTHVNEITVEEQHDTGTSLKTLRLPTAIPWVTRVKEVANFINMINPEWLSLQFVPYSFHKKGLPVTLPQHLKRMGKNRKWHIMFHELWIGVSGKIPFKQKPIRFLQQSTINILLTQLQPKVVATSIATYQQALKNHHARILPLFSNIPLNLTGDNQADGEQSSGNNHLKVICFGSFSTALKDFEAQLNWVNAFATQSDKEVLFLVIGKGGLMEKQALSSIKKIFGQNSIRHFGRLAVEQVSKYMLAADLGLSRADYMMYGKSGSTLCMLEHGLPVLLKGNRPSFTENNHNDISYYQQLVFCDSTSIPSKKQPEERLPCIAQLFLSNLYQAE